jgi:hypothetical protein
MCSNKFLSFFISTLFFSFPFSLVSHEFVNFGILPSPQKFEITGISSLNEENIKNYFSSHELDLTVHNNFIRRLNFSRSNGNYQIHCSIDKSKEIVDEGYTIDISKNKIMIQGKDNRGIFYAFKTLEQLLQDSKEQGTNLPICKIEDYPKLSYRAVHLDIKHHIDKLEYYYDVLDKLASYKVNAIIVELEDKIRYERRPEIGSADAFSIDEWKNLCNYAIRRNIEISPLIQGLGHASYILKHDKYKELRDDPNSDWAFNPLNPKTYEVQFDLYLDAIKATPYGRYLHIGGDEVHTSGRGSHKSAIELQLIWLNKVCEFAEQNGRIPIFWDDMPLKHAEVYKPMFNINLTQEELNIIWQENEHKLIEFLDQFPKNCIYMRWNYSSPQTIGNTKAMEWFRKNGMQVMGATAGQTRWVLMPQNESNIDNIRTFALNSIDRDLNGLLLTLWDDDSPHFELYKRGIIAFAEYTWAGDKRTKQKIKSVYRQREFSHISADSNYAFIDSLEIPVSHWKNILLKKSDRNRLIKSKNPKFEAVIDLPNVSNKGNWSKIYAERLHIAENSKKICMTVAQRIKKMKSLARDNKYTLEVYEQVNNLVNFTFNALLLLKDYDTSESLDQELKILERIKRLIDKFRILRDEFETIYRRTRNLTKPDNYVLDQNHHLHLANQTKSFDWQFYAEMLLLQKIEEAYRYN